MPLIRTDELPGEPIIINTLEGRVGILDIQKTEVVNNQYIEKFGYLYSIGDVRNITTAFPDVLTIIHNDSQGKPGSATDKRMTLILVATSEFVKLFVEAMKQNQGLQIPIFTTVEEAVAEARNLIHSRK